ncbi:MAG: hypothetical protein JKX70_08270 [Phycisphaerales bacterium]|nr:hypothetical protein [Phycisphaerales bacterium]
MKNEAPKYKFAGKEGMDFKICQLAFNCQKAIVDLPRTMAFAVSCPDPASTPDCEMANPRGARIVGLDHNMNKNDIALLIGMMYGFLDQHEDRYTTDYGEEFRDAVDLARSVYGHSVAMSTAIVNPPRSLENAPKWKNQK